MGNQLAREQEQLKNLNCKIRPTFHISAWLTVTFRYRFILLNRSNHTFAILSLREGAPKVVQKFQQDRQR